jgi:erythritol transport system permease protein
MATTASAVLPGGTETEDKNSSAVMLLLKLRTLIALIIVTAYFCIMAPNFISLGNLVIISKHVAINAFLAIGMTYVIVTGGIDLSVGSTVGLVGMISGLLITKGIPDSLHGRHGLSQRLRSHRFRPAHRHSSSD